MPAGEVCSDPQTESSRTNIVRLEFGAKPPTPTPSALCDGIGVLRRDETRIDRYEDRVAMYVVTGQGKTASGAYMEVPADPVLIDEIAIALSRIAASLRAESTSGSKAA